MKPLVVGVAPPNREAPGANGGPAFVGTDSGRRLAALVGGGELTELFDLVNVYDWPVEEWNHEEARQRYRALMFQRVVAAPGLHVVCLGRSVAAAAGLRTVPFEWQPQNYPREHWAAYVPHPSGKTRFWNSTENRDEARAFFRALLNRVDAPPPPRRSQRQESLRRNWPLG